MKMALNAWMVCGFQGENKIGSVLNQVEEMGWDGIELCFGGGELSPETNTKELKKIREDVESVGLEIPSLATGFYWDYSLGSPNHEERNKAIEFTKAYIYTANELGAGAVLVLPGTVDVCFSPNRPVVPAKEVWKWAHDSISQLITFAEQNQVIIALENVWSKFLTGPFEYKKFIDEFHSPWVKAYFDAGNCLINGYPEHWAEILNNQIERIHIKNFKRINGGGTLDNFTSSLLEGDLNWDAFLHALRNIGYDGYLTTEVIVSEQGMPDLNLTKKIASELRQILYDI
ncbi:MAG TPA: sugar phosphate isomerase/epimerase family protein [Candidatus Hydrogenedens sp.]|nr:sugar phosphate isomerase/epimerase family protein [Candidatus Hydrogenedens sp.]